MYYEDGTVPKCQWEGCEGEACSEVYNDTATQSIYVCRFHRGVVAINLELYGTLRFEKNIDLTAINRPTTNPAKGKKKQRPGEQKDWEKEAARKADDTAQPVEPEIVENAEERSRAYISEQPRPKWNR